MPPTCLFIFNREDKFYTLVSFFLVSNMSFVFWWLLVKQPTEIVCNFPNTFDHLFVFFKESSYKSRDRQRRVYLDNGTEFES